jgi:hypothetical protein
MQAIKEKIKSAGLGQTIFITVSTAGNEGEKGGAKERRQSRLKEKVTSPFFPSLWGMEMMVNSCGSLPHSHTPPLTPFSPSDFLPFLKKKSIKKQRTGILCNKDS